MTYFARISSQSRPANRLQEYLLQLIAKFDHVLLDDPEALAVKMEELTKQANRAYPRCTKQEARVNRDFRTKQIQSLGAGGLFTLSIHKVAGLFTAQPNEGPRVLAIEKPTPAPEPIREAPAIPVVQASQLRQAINRSREDDTPLKFEYWSCFSTSVQSLLAKGAVWAIYQTQNQQVIAEEFGGKTHPAYT